MRGKQILIVALHHGKVHDLNSLFSIFKVCTILSFAKKALKWALLNYKYANCDLEYIEGVMKTSACYCSVIADTLMGSTSTSMWNKKSISGKFHFCLQA